MKTGSFVLRGLFGRSGVARVRLSGVPSAVAAARAALGGTALDPAVAAGWWAAHPPRPSRPWGTRSARGRRRRAFW